VKQIDHLAVERQTSALDEAQSVRVKLASASVIVRQGETGCHK